MTPDYSAIRRGINANLAARTDRITIAQDLGRRGKAARSKPVDDKTDNLLDQIFPAEDWQRQNGVIERKRT